jgi:predicted metal-dependent peptidase
MAQQNLRAKHAQKTAEQEQQQRTAPVINPAIDAKLNQFIAANPKLHEHYLVMSKEYLVRKVMLQRMNQSERQEAKVGEMMKWANNTPEVKAKIDKAIANKPEDQRTRIAVAIARREAQNIGMRPSARPTV